jgi:hypothetical protein
MATRSKGRNGLEQAMILLVQNQAAFQSQLIAMNERFARMEGELHEIKSILLRHEGILMRHERLLQDLEDLPEAISNLPEVIRQKIGFKARHG